MIDLVDLVVTQHKALVEYLKELGFVDESVKVLTHIENPEEELGGKIVVGVLPLTLAKFCKAVIVIPLQLSPEDRGKELSVERLREIAGAPEVLVVRSARNYGWDLRDGSQWYESYLNLATQVERSV